jgi:hypothetical protein
MESNEKYGHVFTYFSTAATYSGFRFRILLPFPCDGPLSNKDSGKHISFFPHSPPHPALSPKLEERERLIIHYPFVAIISIGYDRASRRRR